MPKQSGRKTIHQKRMSQCVSSMDTTATSGTGSIGFGSQIMRGIRSSFRPSALATSSSRPSVTSQPPYSGAGATIGREQSRPTQPALVSGRGVAEQRPSEKYSADSQYSRNFLSVHDPKCPNKLDLINTQMRDDDLLPPGVDPRSPIARKIDASSELTALRAHNPDHTLASRQVN